MTNLPVVSFSVDRTVVAEGGEPQIFNFKLSEPAPSGGLTVRLQFDDPDGDPADAGLPQELFNNIDNLQLVVENGTPILEFTISAGATEANFGVATGQDNQVEGDETYTLTLLDDENYSVDTASATITSTVTEKEVINGTPERDTLFGTKAAEFILGFEGNDIIFGRGGEDTIIAGEGNDIIFGGQQADTILAGNGDDIIFARGGNDVIDSGNGLDRISLGDGQSTVILDSGEGFDTIGGFELGATTFQVESTSNLRFVDSARGAQIFQGDDLLALVSFESASTFSNNQDQIFTV
ncbi:calcium-binding protein [Mastigocoleus testarum]|uniref:Calcium-binding protein n=1 Tax=Mastigocoleus testarum BC008 TaxID=371196 RepID=A0A0V7ZMQ6_9CYAN|nr:hypothetical protein [Mastigocoleus testarum]KST65924.1 hypothetical protein BC008_23415 [Mastigocoleus testarum BC008]